MATTYPQRGFTSPPGSTQVTLVRHGQSQAHEPGTTFPMIDGQGNPPLTELGHAQAAAVGERLKTERFDALYASTMVRTQQTAAPLAAALDVEVRIESELREVCVGDWEGGIFREKVHENTHPAVADFFKTGDYGSLPGGESNASLTDRTVAALERIHAAHPDEHVAVFVHGGVIGALLSRATGGTMAGTAGADNGSIHRLSITSGRWFLRAFNDTNHLAEAATPL